MANASRYVLIWKADVIYGRGGSPKDRCKGSSREREEMRRGTRERGRRGKERVRERENFALVYIRAQ